MFIKHRTRNNKCEELLLLIGQFTGRLQIIYHWCGNKMNRYLITKTIKLCYLH